MSLMSTVLLCIKNLNNYSCLFVCLNIIILVSLPQTFDCVLPNLILFGGKGKLVEELRIFFLYIFF